MAIPRLTYFELRGRAEAIRLMHYEMEVGFDDYRIVDADEWETVKSVSPFGRLPLYESGALALCESHAILRHLARSSGWLGADEQRDALFDITQEALSEAQEDLWRFAWVKDYHQKTERYADETLRPRLRHLQKWLRRDARDGQYWVGEAPSHVDFLAFCYLDELDAFFPETLAEFPNLADFRSRIESLPRVAHYVATARPIVFGMGIKGPKIDPRVAIAPGTEFRNPWTQPIALTGSL